MERNDQRRLVVREMRSDDLDVADRVFRLAFGTFIGIPEPESFAGEAQMVRSRWAVDPTAAVIAEVEGEFAGSNFATNWGSVGFFGPLTIRPDLWNQGIAQRLLAATMEIFERWGTRHAGLFTFPHSTKHVYLYQRFGFWPRYLTSIMAKEVTPPAGTVNFSRFSAVPGRERERVLAACAALTGGIYDGLDVRREILVVDEQSLGDTILLFEGERLESFAVCHWTAASEADAGQCYAKFAAVRIGSGAAEAFDRLLLAWRTVASAEGLDGLVAGVNTARHDAYAQLLARGFRTQLQGVTMHRPNEPGYDREDVYLLDDWR